MCLIIILILIAVAYFLQGVPTPRQKWKYNIAYTVNLRMFREFEDAKDAENADDNERSAALGGLTVALGLLDGQYHEVRQDR